MEKVSEIHEKFVNDFWKWFKEHHERRYRKEGKDLTPEFKFHKKHMKFDNYAWGWVAMFIKECYAKKKTSFLNKESQDEI